MRLLKLIVITLVGVLTLGLTTGYNDRASASGARHPLAQGQMLKAGAVGVAPERSGRWVQFIRAATVRKYITNPSVKASDKVFQPGMWFHADDGGGNAVWALGYVCPNGGRFCNKHDNIKGFVLRTALPSLASLERGDSESTAELTDFAPASAEPIVSGNEALYVAASFAPAAAQTASAAGRETLRVCPNVKRPLWVRDNNLHPIGLIYPEPGEKIVVDKYTDGHPNDGKRRWVLGWFYSKGVSPRGRYGRVLLRDDNGFQLICR